MASSHSIFTKLAQAGVIAADDARRMADAPGDYASMDDLLRSAVIGDELSLLQWLSAEYDVPLVDPQQLDIDQALLRHFPARLLLKHQLLPFEQHADGVRVATARLFDTAGIDELRLVCGKQVELALAPAAEINRRLSELVGVGADTLQSLESDRQQNGIEVIDAARDEQLDLEDAADDASIIRFVNQVIAEAVQSRATDVHFEPFEDQLRVRYRIDGVMVEANVPPSVSRYRAAIVSRLKILSHLDIAEKRLPQDGRIKLIFQQREVDLRVSIIPMIHGEAVVLRILDRGTTMIDLVSLGMSPRDMTYFEKTLQLPHGIVLVTGPTGSGKTTTLYAGLSRINLVDRKIITIEDPVEYQLRGVNQIQVSEKTGLTFARGLRSVLRHDPDVILIGEIRDTETAAIAVQASLTGHLVFSTLHTNDAPGALTRLVDMNIEPYLVASSVELVVAQRLVRLICEQCAQPLPVEDIDRLRDEFGVELPDNFYQGRGCRACQHTGYRGRQGVFEMMPITDPIRQLVLDHASSSQVRRVATKQGMQSLRQDGWRLIQQGRTTLEELMRVTKDERGTGVAVGDTAGK
jgi:general secretion pathway protein E/type IV pilus assembly protein PilB